MNSSETYDLTCKALGYSEPDTNQQRFLEEARERLSVDAAFFVKTPQGADLPIIYFKQFSSFIESRDEVRLLHQRVWNQGIVPLLFVICPGEIKVYNCYTEPGSPLESVDTHDRLLKHLESIENMEQIRQGLQDYDSLCLESGDFWRQQGDRFQRNKRVDRLLLSNLQSVRQILRSIPSDSTGKPPEYSDIHNLLGRSIFVLYLQDRQVLQGTCPEDPCSDCIPFTDILPDKNRTYQKFEVLAKHFNGDMFPLSPTEYASIDEAHLEVLRNFLTGTNMKTGQYSFWPYMFNIIPIELISAIYEEFFHQEEDISSLESTEQKENVGTYYTPPFLADFLLEEVLPWQSDDLETRVLDPACGSGVFLVGAYKRLIGRRQRHVQSEKLSAETLIEILKNNIFGVDINSGAVRVTAFSLYLALLDSVDASSIWCQVKFPNLIGTNLFGCDFFDHNATFNGMTFDVVIGNPPWASVPPGKKSLALVHCEEAEYPIGDRQLAQAFLWRAAEFAKPYGIICLLATAKGLLFNESEPNQAFRHAFFSRFDVMTIINFTLWKSFLFPTAGAPCAAVIFRHCSKEAQTSSLMYVVPKLSAEPRALNAVVIDAPDIKYIPRSLTVTDSRIWKVAMWCGIRDMELVSRFSGYSRLKDACKLKGREPSEGFTQGNQSESSTKKYNKEWAAKHYRIPGHEIYHRPEMASLPYMTPNALKVGKNVSDLNPLGEEFFERPRTLELYKAPAVLIPQSPTKGRINAKYVDNDVVFSQSVLSFPSTPDNSLWLRFVEGFLNSSLAIYLLFVMSPRWGIDRDEFLAEDIYSLPIIPDDTIDAMMQTLGERPLIDQDIFKAYDLSKAEQSLVRDTVHYTIDFYQNGENSEAMGHVGAAQLLSYSAAFSSLLRELVSACSYGVSGTIYVADGSPLTAITFNLGTKQNQQLTVCETSDQMREVMGRLDSLLLSQHSQAVYTKRHIRIYDGDSITIVKPNKLRYWTASQAIVDADDMIAEILAGGLDADVSA